LQNRDGGSGDSGVDGYGDGDGDDDGDGGNSNSNGDGGEQSENAIAKLMKNVEMGNIRDRTARL